MVRRWRRLDTLVFTRLTQVPVGRAFILRYISGFFQKVILYHHPYDVVPIMAFSHDKGPPVIIENHAHSWFWLAPRFPIWFGHIRSSIETSR